MKKLLIIAIMMVSVNMMAQPTGYYNGTEGKTGTALKSALNNIISGHTPWEYYYVKYILANSDADPDSAGNVILVYTGRSNAALDYGTGGDHLNREHVWAKSHGGFGTTAPTGCDAHNLKPADASVNIDRSNKDFDNCQATGTQHAEATGCYYTSDAWEPRDGAKGDVARILFYMATRYEGANGEIDLEVNDQLNNYPNPLHGKLSALLQWNEQDPPDEFERHRNDVIFGYQHNRNPFVDHPEWVNMIWNSASSDVISIGNVQKSGDVVTVNDDVNISSVISGSESVTATIEYGTQYDNLSSSVVLTASGNNFSGTIPAQSSECNVYFKIQAISGTDTVNSVVYKYHVQGIFSGTIKPIIEVQGEQDATPFANTQVTVTGVVTANFGEGFFIQDAQGPWSGMYIYDAINPHIGDSVIVTGTVVEYYDFTEIQEVSDYYLISRNNTLPTPKVLTIGQVTEAYESVLVNVSGGTCTNPDSGYGTWEITDNTGAMKVLNSPIYAYTPILNNTYSITGPVKWDYGEWKIELRHTGDVQDGVDIINPTVSSVELTDETHMTILFSEPVDVSTAQQVANYTFNDNISTVSATVNGFVPSQVILVISGVTTGTHEVTISNVQDLASNVMETQTLQFTATVGIDNPEQNFVIYPNPTKNGTVQISNSVGINKVEILDVTGRIIRTISVVLQKDITVDNLKSGVYFISVLTKDNHKTTKKVIVE